MQTEIDGIADGIYRISAYVQDAAPDGFARNHVSADSWSAIAGQRSVNLPHPISA